MGKQKKHKSKMELYGELHSLLIEKAVNDVFCQLSNDSLFGIEQAKQVLHIAKIDLERASGLCDDCIEQAASNIFRLLKEISLSSALHTLDDVERQLEKRLWGTYDFTEASFTAFLGGAFDTKSNSKKHIFIIAKGKIMAKKFYNECLVRHSNLKALENPEIVPLWNSDDFLEDFATEEKINELAQFGSIPL